MYNLKFQHSQMKACVTAKFKIILKEPQIKHQTICSWWNRNMSTWPFLWQSRSFRWDLWPSREINSRLLLLLKQVQLCILKPLPLFLARCAHWLHSWEKQIDHRLKKRAIACSTWYSCFLPTYSERKTTKNGVTRSLIPWTYPLAGCRMAQINRILSKI